MVVPYAARVNFTTSCEVGRLTDPLPYLLAERGQRTGQRSDMLVA
jgi:hypothetical protein